jgi:hypothetical protein
LETIKFLMDTSSLDSISFVCLKWSVMMGDPGSSDLSYPTVICVWIALPNHITSNIICRINYFRK